MAQAPCSFFQHLGKEEVFSRFDDLAKELAYIEALREYYNEIYRLYSVLKKFQAIYRDDAGAVCMRGQNTSQAVSVTFVP